MTSDTKVCPFCAEEIKAAAKLCKHCRSVLDDSSPTQPTAEVESLLADAAEEKKRSQGSSQSQLNDIPPSTKQIAKPKRGLMIFLAALTVLGLFIGTGALIAIGGWLSSSGKSDPPASQSEVEQAPKEAATSQTAPSDSSTEAIHRIGETFTLGNLTYRFHSVEKKKSLGNEFMRTEAGADATFIVVPFEVRNEGNTSQTILTDNFELVTPDERSYKPDSEACTTYVMSKNKGDWLLSQLHPGLLKKGVTVFRIPLKFASQRLILLVPEEGFLSSGQARVDLSNKSSSMQPAPTIPGGPVIVVQLVPDNKFASNAGIIAGDQIQKIDGQRVASANQMIALTSPHKGSSVDVEVRRDGITKTFHVQTNADGQIGVALGEPQLAVLDSSRKEDDRVIAFDKLERWKMVGLNDHLRKSAEKWIASGEMTVLQSKTKVKAVEADIGNNRAVCWTKVLTGPYAGRELWVGAANVDFGIAAQK